MTIPQILNAPSILQILELQKLAAKVASHSTSQSSTPFSSDNPTPLDTLFTSGTCGSISSNTDSYRHMQRSDSSSTEKILQNVLTITSNVRDVVRHPSVERFSTIATVVSNPERMLKVFLQAVIVSLVSVSIFAATL